MTRLDWIVVGVYLAGMIALSLVIARGQTDRRDYYLGGNRSGATAIALSTMATQCSTNSILGAPAFVAFSIGGGLLWLQYELAVPLAMIVIMALLLPTFRSLALVSVYEYLERRFGLATRITLSLLFQLIRAFATGVTVYGAGLIMAVCLETDFLTAVILLGVVTVIYDAIGGMRAVIVSDVIQLIVLFGAILLAIAVAVNGLGGIGAVFAAVPAERLVAVDFGSTGWGDGQDYAFWPMLIGGLFLYVSYYGCDQSQTQRLLATRSVADGNRALLLNGLLRFPLVLSYCLLGVCLAAYAAADPEFLSRLPSRETGSGEQVPNFNLAMPQFVFEQFPPGLVGLVMVGLFAAAMSSLDSVLNALSATTMEDLVRRFRRTPMSERAEFLTAKALTVFWGVVTVAMAFFVDDIADSVLVAINKIGSLVNGPLLAVFLLGLLTRRVDQRGVLLGLAAGFGLDLWLWLAHPEISWLWWNLTGFLATVVVALLLSGTRGVERAEVADAHVGNPHVGNPHVANAHVANAHVANAHLANAHLANAQVASTKAASAKAEGGYPTFSRAGLARDWWPSYLALAAWAGVILAVSLAFTALA